MNWPGLDRWLRLCQAARATDDPISWYEKLTKAYAEPHRHYHNQQHIAECLSEFTSARHLAQDPVAVELAVWFHDAFYDPKAGNNEERSAAMVSNCLEASGLSPLGPAVHELIMATKAHLTEAGTDAALMVDVDLSILGQNAPRFSEYEAQIREEYHWVPRIIFNLKRAQILEGFLARQRIYATDFFAAKYEQSARGNLEASIRHLKGA